MIALSQLGFDQAMVTMALGLARVTPALMFLPMLGEKPMGRGVLRTTLLALITLGLLPVLSRENVDVTALSLPATLLKEGLIGLILGMMLGAPYLAAMTFGEFLDNQRGATIAKSIDPTADVESSLLGSFIGFLWAALFFSGGGLLWIIATIADSYRTAVQAFKTCCRDVGEIDSTMRSISGTSHAYLSETAKLKGRTIPVCPAILSEYW